VVKILEEYSLRRQARYSEIKFPIEYWGLNRNGKAPSAPPRIYTD
jgi:hypothetical protein